MKLFVRIYAEDLQSACSTIRLTIKNANPGDLTLGDLRKEIEKQITQPHVFKRKNQLISIQNENGELVSA